MGASSSAISSRVAFTRAPSLMRRSFALTWSEAVAKCLAELIREYADQLIRCDDPLVAETASRGQPELCAFGSV
jgi:hypothetical protein